MYAGGCSTAVAAGEGGAELTCGLIGSAACAASSMRSAGDPLSVLDRERTVDDPCSNPYDIIGCGARLLGGIG